MKLIGSTSAAPSPTSRSPSRPLVRRRHRRTVTERLIPPKGEVLVPLDEDEGVEAIAVCFLFARLDRRHEERAAEIVRETYPECFLPTSASVSPQFREFERFTTGTSTERV